MERLEAIRQAYHSSEIRPFKIDYGWNNYILLEEGFRVTWEHINEDISRSLYLRDYQMVKILLKGIAEEVQVIAPLHTPTHIVDELSRVGIEVIFDYITIPAQLPEKYDCLDYCLNLYHNHTQPLTFELSGSSPALEFFQLMRKNYQIDTSNIYNPTFEFISDNTFSDADLHNLFIWALDNQAHGFMERILHHGYMPKIEEIINASPDTRMIIFLLGFEYFSDEFKIELLSKILVCRPDDYLLYRTSVAIKYLKMIKNCEGLDEEVRRFILEDIVPNSLPGGIFHYNPCHIEIVNITYYYGSRALDYELLLNPQANQSTRYDIYKKMANDDKNLRMCINPAFREYWMAVPSSNLNLYEYLYWKEGILISLDLEIKNIIGYAESNPTYLAKLLRLVRTKHIQLQDHENYYIIRRLIDYCQWTKPLKSAATRAR